MVLLLYLVIYLFIEVNSALISLDGLNGLTSINEGFRIEDNHLLTSLNGLNSLIYMKSLIDHQ
jgi:hypothetical protein